MDKQSRSEITRAPATGSLFGFFSIDPASAFMTEGGHSFFSWAIKALELGSKRS